MIRIPLIEEFKDEMKFTDEYGATVIVEFFEYKGEKWVRILIDSSDEEVRSYLEEHDEGVHMSLDLFKTFFDKTYRKVRG